MPLAPQCILISHVRLRQNNPACKDTNSVLSHIKKNHHFHGAITEHFQTNLSPVERGGKLIQPYDTSEEKKNPISYFFTIRAR